MFELSDNVCKQVILERKKKPDLGETFGPRKKLIRS